MKKQRKNSTSASALQVTLAIALLSVSAILLASSFKAAPARGTEPIVNPSKNNMPPDAPAVTPFLDIGSPFGPLTHVWLGNELSCQVQHTTDGTIHEFYPPGTIPGDCGTFIAMGGILYAPDFLAHGGTATGSIGTRTVFTPVSQGPVTGSGTSLAPFTVITIVAVPGTGLVIEQTDTYIIGDEHYSTEVKITNSGPATASGVLYRAGDAFLGGSDFGYGFTETFGTQKAVGCSVNANNTPPGRIEEWIPLVGGNNYYQNFYATVWSAIGTKAPFPDTCTCATLLDNGGGVSWNFSIVAGGMATYSHVTTFSPLGREGLVTSKTADSPSSQVGTQNGYTITIHNPNATAATLSSITDNLPAGFTYVPGSTTGVTTNDPGIVGQMLTWTGPFVVAGSGSISLHFSVIVAGTPGTYFNDAGGTAEGGDTVISTGPTAPITVTAPTQTPTPSPTPTPTPSPISTPTPTPTPTPTSTPTETPAPTPTPIPQRCTPVTSCVTGGFNGTSIPTSRYIWFTANMKATGIPATGATINFTNSVIMITSRNGNFNYPTRDGVITFDPNATCATTTFSGTQWVTTVPVSGSDEVLLSALGIQPTVDLKGAKIKWCASFTADTNNIQVSWKTGSAVYTSDMTEPNYNALGVKPTHTHACLYNNSDHAGTPENRKRSLVAGAAGGGGSNWTGSWGATSGLKLCPGTPAATPTPTPTPSPTPVVPQGSCQASSSLAVLVDDVAQTVVAYVPHGNWNLGVTGVGAVNVEGSSITNTAIGTADPINSCASNSVTGQTVCTANNNKVYILKGTVLDPAVTTNPLTSSGSGTIFFSGGTCTNCGVAMDAVHNKAVIGLAVSQNIAGFQFLNLGGTPSFETAFASMDSSSFISEDPLIDPTRNTLGLNSVTLDPAGALLLSPSEDNNYEIMDVTTSTSPAFFERPIPNNGFEADSAAEDCSTGIVLAPYEFTNPSQIFVADLNSATFTPGSPGSWTGLSAVNTLTGSTLNCAGPTGIAVAQGTHTGIVSDEFGCNAVTAIALPPTSGVVILPAWLTCSIPNLPNGNPFNIGNDPHTVTAYKSPNNGHAYALIANGGFTPPTYLARIDLTLMLALAETSAGSHVCAVGTLPPGVVNFIAVP